MLRRPTNRFTRVLLSGVLVAGAVLAAGCGDRGAGAMAQAAPEGNLPPIQLVEFVRGMRNPVYLTHDGVSQRIYIVEQAGRVRLIDDRGVQKSPYLDIVPAVQSGGECGLLSIAFHPDFATNGRIYLNYTAKRPKLMTVISEFHVDSPDARQVNPATERILLTIDQPYPNHNGGQLQFGPDGMLYIGMGDGGSAGDPRGNAQNPVSLLGKMLRIDVTPRKGYAMPKDNPFFGDQRFRPEIWAWGLRNPWRFSFDRKTGDCFAGDVGQNLYEEVDRIVAGGNYGWNRREGFHEFNTVRRGGRGREQDAEPDFLDPLAEYERDKGLSVTGGYVYRGQRFPALQGLYIYADYGSGRFFGLRYENGKVTERGEFAVTRNGKPVLNRVQPASFGEDPAGELYVCDYNGVVYRIEMDLR